MATYKQKLALQKMVDNGGNIGKAMRDAGYSPNTAKTPQKLTESKGWQELIDETIPEELIAETLRAGLLASKIKTIKLSKYFDISDFESIGRVINTIQVKGETIVTYLAPDYSTRNNALDKCLKIRGRYNNTLKIEHKDPYADMSDEELNQREKEIKKMLERYNSA